MNNVSQLSSPQLLHAGGMYICEACLLISDLKIRLLVGRHHEGIRTVPDRYSSHMSDDRENSSHRLLTPIH